MPHCKIYNPDMELKMQESTPLQYIPREGTFTRLINLCVLIPCERSIVQTGGAKGIRFTLKSKHSRRHSRFWMPLDANGSLRDDEFQHALLLFLAS